MCNKDGRTQMIGNATKNRSIAEDARHKKLVGSMKCLMFGSEGAVRDIRISLYVCVHVQQGLASMHAWLANTLRNTLIASKQILSTLECLPQSQIQQH